MISPGVLKDFLFFADLNPPEVESLSAIADEVLLPQGDLIFAEGDPAHALYLLLEGWVDIMIDIDARGHHRELVTSLTPGNIFGWSAVVEPYIYTTSAICASPVKAISFKGVDLRALFDTNQSLHCAMITRICQVIASRLRATRRQMASLFVID